MPCSKSGRPTLHHSACMKTGTTHTASRRPTQSNLLANHFIRPMGARFLRRISMTKPLRLSRNTESPTHHTMPTPNMAELRGQYFHETLRRALRVWQQLAVGTPMPGEGRDARTARPDEEQPGGSRRLGKSKL